jgi:trigger factor
MKVNVEDISSVKKKLLIEIPKEDVIKETDKFFNKLRKTVNLKGFRTGKIPRSVLESRFRKEAASEIGAELVNISYSQAVEENNLVPLGVPEFDYPEVVSGQDYKYTTTIEVKPLVSIKDYTGLKLKKSVYKVTDDKIEEKLRKLQKNLAQMRTIDEERPVTNGDFVQIDYEGFKDDKNGRLLD